MINAVGRLGDAWRAFDLLTTESRSEAGELVKVLHSENQRRKEVDRHVTMEAIEKARTEVDLDRACVLVLASRNWHSGVVGIVASRLVERFHRPAVLISIEDNGVGKGSARSVPGFHIYDAISRCANHLVKFGGHAHAAGLTILENNIESFRAQFTREAEASLAQSPRGPVVNPCGRIRLSEIDDRFMLLLKMLEPYGPGNSRPVFYADGLRISGRPSIAGGEHLKFKAAQDDMVFETIGFGMADRRDHLEGRLYDFGAAFDIEENSWNGTLRIQLRIKGLDL
jgi:single-stranded-DNA-specific exonuclease